MLQTSASELLDLRVNRPQGHPTSRSGSFASSKTCFYTMVERTIGETLTRYPICFTRTCSWLFQSGSTDGSRCFQERRFITSSSILHIMYSSPPCRSYGSRLGTKNILEKSCSARLSFTELALKMCFSTFGFSGGGSFTPLGRDALWLESCFTR